MRKSNITLEYMSLIKRGVLVLFAIYLFSFFSSPFLATMGLIGYYYFRYVMIEKRMEKASPEIMDFAVVSAETINGTGVRPKFSMKYVYQHTNIKPGDIHLGIAHTVKLGMLILTDRRDGISVDVQFEYPGTINYIRSVDGVKVDSNHLDVQFTDDAVNMAGQIIDKYN